MRAKLTVPDAPEAGAGVRRMELDCAHGVTSGYFVRGSDAVSEVDILNLKKGRDAFGRERLVCSFARYPFAEPGGRSCRLHVPEAPAEHRRVGSSSGATIKPRTPPRWRTSPVAPAAHEPARGRTGSNPKRKNGARRRGGLRRLAPKKGRSHTVTHPKKKRPLSEPPMVGEQAPAVRLRPPRRPDCGRSRYR